MDVIGMRVSERKGSIRMTVASSQTRASERFELTSYLNGRTRAWGVFEDRFGRLRRRFEVEMNGQWQGDRFRLDERFVYDTGQIENRTWHIVPGENGRFTATCADCIGEASGVCGTDSVRMSYRFRLQLDRRSVVVDLNDRIYRMGDAIAVNRATMSKWGVTLGELSLFFERVPVVDGAHRSAA
jgi:Protein of unknown function (DUF3833)